MILVKETAPTPESLGATNGLVQFAMSLTRSICPAFARYVGGYFIECQLQKCKPEIVRSLRCWLVANSPQGTCGLLLWQVYLMPGLYLAVKSNAAENRSSSTNSTSRTRHPYNLQPFFRGFLTNGMCVLLGGAVWISIDITPGNESDFFFHANHGFIGGSSTPAVR